MEKELAFRNPGDFGSATQVYLLNIREMLKKDLKGPIPHPPVLNGEDGHWMMDQLNDVLKV